MSAASAGPQPAVAEKDDLSWEQTQEAETGNPRPQTTQTVHRPAEFSARPGPGQQAEEGCKQAVPHLSLSQDNTEFAWASEQSKPLSDLLDVGAAWAGVQQRYLALEEG